MAFIAVSLQSGSNGNCTYVETRGVRLLFDAGIRGIQAERRLAQHGRDIRQVDALIISHDHSDHIRCAGVFQRKYGMPIYVTSRTLKAALRKQPLGRLEDVRYFHAGEILKFKSVAVETIPTEHDSADGTAFVIASGKKRLGILTDLGYPFRALARVISSLDAVFIESNYDIHMLETGPYPRFLKRRIKGSGGHLSNVEAAKLVGAWGKRLKWACLSHLSEQNNHADVALATHREIVGPGLKLYVAGRYSATDILKV